MGKIKNNINELVDFQNVNGFTKIYLKVLDHRLAQASLEVEDEINDDKISTILEISGHYDALIYLFKYYASKQQIEPIEEVNLVINLIRILSNGAYDKLRNTVAGVLGSNVPRTEPKYIRIELYHLIDDYNYMIENAKTEEEKLFAIASFHIRFLHIHPFDDANGRTGRLLLTQQLISNGFAPAIITKQLKPYYCDLIEKSDYLGMQNFIMTLSNKEYDEICLLNENYKSRRKR